MLPLCRQHGVSYLDLGGWAPVEGYLSVNLSRVELYGIPRVARTTYEQIFDEQSGQARLVHRDLTDPAVVLHFDVNRGIPLPDQSMHGINLSHVLEHFPLAHGGDLLQECYRVLWPGGVLRVSCPDLRRYAEAYVNRDLAFFQAVSGPAFCRYVGLDTLGDRFISKAYDGDGGHQWFFDVESVDHLLHRAGFTRIKECRVHESALPCIDRVEPGYRERESFYVEAVR